MAGQLTASNISDGTNTGSTTDMIKGSAKAWVNFNGTLTSGNIRSSYNVSSVVKNGGGDYTINFTNNMLDANYVITATASDNTDANSASIGIYDASQSGTNPSASSYRLAQVTAYSSTIVCTAVFR